MPGLKCINVKTNNPIEFRLLSCVYERQGCVKLINPNATKKVCGGVTKKYAHIYFREQGLNEHYLTVFIEGNINASSIIERFDNSIELLSISNTGAIHFFIVVYRFLELQITSELAKCETSVKRHFNSNYCNFRFLDKNQNYFDLYNQDTELLFL